MSNSSRAKSFSGFKVDGLPVSFIGGKVWNVDYVDLDTALPEHFLFESMVLFTSYESDGTRLCRKILFLISSFSLCKVLLNLLLVTV